MFLPLDAPIKDFAWGSTGAISAFRALATSSAREAEQWFGGHPRGGTRIFQGVGETEFSGWLAKEKIEFPLLVKLLAATEPPIYSGSSKQQASKRWFRGRRTATSFGRV